MCKHWRMRLAVIFLSFIVCPFYHFSLDEEKEVLLVLYKCSPCLVPRFSRGHFFSQLSYASRSTDQARGGPLVVYYNVACEQIFQDRIARLHAFYNADGSRICELDDRWRNPSPIFVWFIVFWLCVRHLSHTVPFSTTIQSREKLISFPDLTLLDTWPWEICIQDKGKLLVMCNFVQTGLLRLAFRYLQASLVIT